MNNSFQLNYNSRTSSSSRILFNDTNSFLNKQALSLQKNNFSLPLYSLKNTSSSFKSNSYLLKNDDATILKHSELLTKKNMLEKVIKDVLSKEKLFSAMKISKLCAMDYNDVLKILDNHQDFKKSFLKSNGGYNVYYKKTFMNIFYDLVTSFRFFCYLRD